MMYKADKAKGIKHKARSRILQSAMTLTFDLKFCSFQSFWKVQATLSQGETKYGQDKGYVLVFFKLTRYIHFHR